MNELFLQYSGDVLDKYAVKADGKLIEYGSAARLETAPGAVYCGRAGDCVKTQEAAFIILKISGKDTLRGYLKTSTVKPGDRLPVQIIAPAEGDKPARLTDMIRLSGKYCVLLLGGQAKGQQVKLSNRILDPAKRTELAELGDKLLNSLFAWYRTENIESGFFAGGLIMRTACENADNDAILTDACTLKSVLDSICRKYSELAQNGGEGLIYVKPVEEHLADEYPDAVVKRGNEGLFEREGIDREYARASGRKVYLPSGGNIIIDRTAAMTVIDVNTDAASAHTRRELILNTNLEAVEEIARQLRLRKITGITVCDLINMDDETDKSTVLQKIRTLFEQDPAKPEVFGFTKLGLLEISRKRSVIS